MASFAYLILVCAAALGGGAVVLRIAEDRFSAAERLVIAFALGVGVMGWAIFFLALTKHAGKAEFLALFGLFASGLWRAGPWFAGVAAARTRWRLEPITCLLLGAIGLVAIGDLCEGLSPPADGDTLAYHFALPKAFLGAGGLFPIYQAIEGTIPLLHHMTYMAALGVGGETVLTLWTMVTGWGATALVYIIARRFLGTNWSLALALIFASTPAVIFGAGSGQIEVRNAMFVLVAALATAEARTSGKLSYATLAGLAAGFFVGAKYTGLIFAFACGVAMLQQRRWLVQGAVYSLAVVVAGGQWYAWNAWITGDPIFPLLYGGVDYVKTVPWNAEIHAAYKTTINDKALPANLLWLFLYPLKATLFADPRFESLRVGFGPIVLLALPSAVFGAWRHRRRMFNHPLFSFALIAVIAYAVWFLFGPSQRVRHLVPIYPLLLICVAVAAVRTAAALPALKGALTAAFAAVVLLHLAAVGLFSLNYARHVLSGESREAFLNRTVSEYGAVTATRPHLNGNGLVLVSSRQLVYLFDVPVFYANTAEQAVVEIHGAARDPVRLWHQLRRAGITEMILPFVLSAEQPATPYGDNTAALWKFDCIMVLKRFFTRSLASRTLPTLRQGESPFTLARLTPKTCAFGAD